MESNDCSSPLLYAKTLNEGYEVARTLHRRKGNLVISNLQVAGVELKSQRIIVCRRQVRLKQEKRLVCATLLSDRIVRLNELQIILL